MNNRAMQVGIIGAGTMGSILIRRLSGAVAVASITVLDPVPNKQLAQRVRRWYRDEYEALVRDCDTLIIAVKPQDFSAMAPRLRAAIETAERRAVLSIMAGVSLEQLAATLQTRRIGRMMPNIAARYGRATVAAAWLPTPDADDLQARLLAIGQRLGTVLELGEQHFDAFIALSGSGIAFILQTIHALTMGGVRCGLPAAVAEQIVAQTCAGAAATLVRSGHHPQELIRAICSPGGTTIAGMTALEEHGFTAALLQAVRSTAEAAQRDMRERQYSNEGAG